MGRNRRHQICMADRRFQSFSTCRLPTERIFPVARVDSSGSTSLFTKYLATDPSWTLGAFLSIQWPVCTRQLKGSEGILAYLPSQKYSVGYAEAGLVRGLDLGLAALQNAAGSFVHPMDLHKMSDILQDDLIVPFSTANTSWGTVNFTFPRLSNAYPVAGFEYFIVDANLSDKGYPQGLIIKELVLYSLSNAVQIPLSWWGFAALPQKVMQFVKRDSKAIIEPERPEYANTNFMPLSYINVYESEPVTEVCNYPC